MEYRNIRRNGSSLSMSLPIPTAPKRGRRQKRKGVERGALYDSGDTLWKNETIYDGRGYSSPNRPKSSACRSSFR